jgi:2-amino-4-hydroxy-6-hydroxymethyldihydropteridine diphosphokinase
VRAYLGLGSNVGDRRANLQQAVDLLDVEPGIRITHTSEVWETDPVGGPSQPDFLNAVAGVRTQLTPWALLAACGRVEHALGRVRDVRWGPRTIDIDILLMQNTVMSDPKLTVPHPRLTERAFALLPLLQLAPTAKLPDGTPLAAFAGQVGAQGARVVGPPLVP